MVFYASTIVDIAQITIDFAPDAQIVSCSQRSVSTFTLLGVTLVVGFLISRGGHFIKEQIINQNGGSYD